MVFQGDGKLENGGVSADEKPGSAFNLQGLRTAVIEWRHSNSYAETNDFKELKPFRRSTRCEH